MPVSDQYQAALSYYARQLLAENFYEEVVQSYKTKVDYVCDPWVLDSTGGTQQLSVEVCTDLHLGPLQMAPSGPERSMIGSERPWIE